jgi:hypothetical protein
MKRIIISIFLIVTALIYAEDYIEASGQTVAFNLSAGAKAGWDKNASAIRSPRIINQTTSRSVISGLINQKYVAFSIRSQEKQQPLSIAVYRFDGRLLTRAPVSNTNTIALDHPLPNGCYWLRLESNGKALATTRLWVTR